MYSSAWLSSNTICIPNLTVVFAALSTISSLIICMYLMLPFLSLGNLVIHAPSFYYYSISTLTYPKYGILAVILECFLSCSELFAKQYQWLLWTLLYPIEVLHLCKFYHSVIRPYNFGWSRIMLSICFWNFLRFFVSGISMCLTYHCWKCYLINTHICWYIVGAFFDQLPQGDRIPL